MRATDHRVRRAIVCLLLGAGLLTTVATPVAAASKGPDHQKVPDHVIARVEALQRVFGSLSIDPTSGPVGTSITFSGFCGFPADTVAVALSVPLDNGGYFAVELETGIPVPPSKYGKFSASLVVPAFYEPANDIPVTPGDYYRAFAVCDLGQPDQRELGPVPFTVTGEPGPDG